MKKVIHLYTAIKPNSLNFGGPSGLPWEVVECLKSMGAEVSVFQIQANSIYNKLGIYSRRMCVQKCDIAIVYPLNAYFGLDTRNAQKVFVLGPDSASLLYARFAKNGKGLFWRLRSWLLCKWFKFKEKQILESATLMVVGQNDSRWVRSISDSSNVIYLPHPLLSSVVKDVDFDSFGSGAIRFVFSGDLSSKYTGNYIDEMCEELLRSNIQLSILVVGKSNLHVFEKFRKILLDVKYMEWVEDYSEICNPSQYVHVAPLKCGAGTKNRVLTAVSMGTLIITTPIGAENIKKMAPNSLIVRSKPVDIIKEMERLGGGAYSSPHPAAVDVFRRKINSNFQDQLKKVVSNGGE